MKMDKYIGQEQVKRLLMPELTAVKESNGRLRHMLLEGPYGVGKTELARVMAEEIGAPLVEMPDARGLTAKKLRGFFHDLAIEAVDEGTYSRDGYPEKGVKPHIILIDEIHNATQFEFWYDVLEKFHITILGEPSWIPYFTLIACTTYPEQLPQPFLSRLPLRFRLDYYTDEELARIILWHFPAVSEKVAKESAKRSRGVARNAINLAQSAHIYGSEDYFDVAGIDPRGLTELDRQYLDVLATYPDPVGIQTMSARLGADVATLRGTVEPYLVRLGLLEITERGRKPARVGLGRRD